MSHRHIATALAAFLSLAAMAPISSYAAPSAPPADPSQSMAKIAAALGVTTDEFNACFAGANPIPQGGKQSGPPQGQPPGNSGDPGNGPGQQMKAELLSCLHNANAKITADQLDQAMRDFGPIGPGGGPGGPGGGNGAPPPRN